MRLIRHSKNRIINELAYRSGSLRFPFAKLFLIVLLCLPVFVLLSCNKASYAEQLYSRILYSATAEGRKLNAPERNRESLYLWILDSIPLLNYLHTREKEPPEEPLEAPVNFQMLSQDTAENSSNQSAYPSEDWLILKENMLREQSRVTGITYSHAEMLSGVQGTQSLADLIQVENRQEIEHSDEKTLETILSEAEKQYNWNSGTDRDRFLTEHYIVDPSVGKVGSVIQGEPLLNKNLRLSEKKDQPQILIYHTHGTEGYLDSREGVEADTVIGAGDLLCEALNRAGFAALHDRTTYDFVNGKDNRNYAYSTARPEIIKTLEKYPTIEVILDLHRDAGAARTTTINGERTAQIMFFNGLSQNTSGPISYLNNQNLTNNLAFSLQLNLLGRERYPGLMYKIYLKNYRYNMHLTGRYLLVELGTERNTVAEAMNGAKLLAQLLIEAINP